MSNTKKVTISLTTEQQKTFNYYENFKHNFRNGNNYIC